MTNITYDSITLDISEFSELNEIKIEEIGYENEELIKRKNNAWAACYQDYLHLGGNRYKFNYQLKTIE